MVIQSPVIIPDKFRRLKHRLDRIFTNKLINSDKILTNRPIMPVRVLADNASWLWVMWLVRLLKMRLIFTNKTPMRLKRRLITITSKFKPAISNKTPWYSRFKVVI